MGCSKSFKELLHIRNAADPWMCVVLRMENRVKGWCAEDEPCSSSSSSSSRKKQTAQTLQVYESNHSDKQSSRLNMWSHPDAVASSVHQQQEMEWAKERPIVKKICHLFFFSWYVISEHHLTVNCEQSASLGCLLTSSTKDNIEQITLHV
ncbi:unnamed protein product [Sphagnum jensenii]|uniref:Uncharacterized protein n=1 Tax=Sphagnum jensenii TaxID=128206 RepID=A0ABP1BH16_9BRYO